MKLVTLPDIASRPLSFYLAEEEWLARRCQPDDYFFIWQVEPTVIIGRNQLLYKEIDVDFCEANDIRIVRRKSGGGAVVADLNNIMLSYVTAECDSVVTTFSAYTGMVADALRSLGLDATPTTRNDILIDGRKVSGNSFYRIPGRSIVHGTMLYDCDCRLMERILRPAPAKLKSHGVDSVRSRVTTIREHLPEIGIEEFKNALVAAILNGGTDIFQLSENDVAEITEMSREYDDSRRLTALNPHADVEVEKRIDGIGSLKTHIVLRKGIIADFTLTGDYLETADASAEISRRLTGCRYTRADVSSALAATDLSILVPGLKTDDFTDLIF